MSQPSGPERYPDQRSDAPNPYLYTSQAEHPQGTVVLVLGVVGIFVPIVSFVAWYLGRQAQREVDAAPGFYRNADQVRIGRILGLVLSWVQIASLALSAVFLVLWVVVFASLVGSS